MEFPRHAWRLVFLIGCCLQLVGSSSLSYSGSHVCTKTLYYTYSRSSRYSSGWVFGKSSHTRYHLVSATRTGYRCCPGWTTASSSSTGCTLAICYGKTNQNGACNQRGNCVAPDACRCNTGYTDHQCNRCLDARGTAQLSIYWHTTRHPDCALTCSWKNQWCWPGDCTDRNLRTSCKCRKGFVKKDGGSSYTKCDSDVHSTPKLLSCGLGMTTTSGQKRNSTQGNPNSCQREGDTYVSVRPDTMFFRIGSSLDYMDLKNRPVFIKETDYGIVSGKAVISKTTVAGSRGRTLMTKSLRGGDFCNASLTDKSPSHYSACSETVNVASAHVQDGERLCVDFTVYGGGFFTYTDFDNRTIGDQIYTRRPSSKHLCFRYDSTAPEHCSQLTGSGHCKSSPLELSTRVTRTGVITIRTSGWTDPVPKGGRPDTASGIDHSVIEIHTTEHMGKIIHTEEKTTIKTNISNTIQMTLPTKEGLYAVMLNVKDIAGNIRSVRRLVLYDNTSRLNIDTSIDLRVFTASDKTVYKWQTNLGPVCAIWKGRYYNDKLKGANNPLDPVKQYVGVNKDYDQSTGTLPTTGTSNVDGIIDARYSFAVDSGPWSPVKYVPNFTNQSLCITPKLLDGQSYELKLQFTDIVHNVLNDSLVVNIDSTVPDISNMWLVKNGIKQVYVHDSLDLSTMILQFDVMDPHSGIQFAEWYLGTKDSSQDVGHGVLPVEKLNQTSCPTISNCYCPSVGICQYFNHTVKLNSLVANKTNIASHNQAFYFTVVAINEAGLRSVDHLDILVDTSPPLSGTVKEGSVDGPDVDYTSEDMFLVHWDGFFDHESGISHYLVSVGPRCLTVKEVENDTANHHLAADKQNIRLSVKLSGKLFVTVVAYNLAQSPSKAVCSDGITKDTTPPGLFNIELRNARISTDQIACDKGITWLVRNNLTLTQLPQTKECKSLCINKTSGLVQHLPRTDRKINDTDIASSYCRHLQYFDHSSMIFLPSDKIHLFWNHSEKESQILDFLVGFGSDATDKDAPDILSFKSSKRHNFFKVSHGGFAGKNIFYMFLKAINKASLKSTVTMGPLMVDNTPPVSTEKIVPRTRNEYVYVTWKNTTFHDPEQALNSFTVLYRIEHGGKHITPILQTPSHILETCQKEGFAGCIRYPLKRLKKMDSELNQPFVFELYVYNAAGHFSIVRTEQVKIPSAYSPGSGIVYDLNPDMSNIHRDINFHSAVQKACVYWIGFHHHQNVTFEAAFGSSFNKSDVLSFRHVSSNSSYCITSSNLKPGLKYFAVIRATCSGGTTYASSNGFVIIDKSSFKLDVYDGQQCNFQLDNVTDLILETSNSNSTALRTYIPRTRFHTGHTYVLRSSEINSLSSLDIRTVDSGQGSLNANLRQFIPLTPKPRFTSSSLNVSASTYSCSLDQDYTQSHTKLSAYWVFQSALKLFMTHFQAVIREESNCHNKSKCFNDISQTKTLLNEFSVDFTNLQLQDGRHYEVFVRPCFDNVCLPWKASDGVKIVSSDPELSISLSDTNQTSTGCYDANIHIDYVSCNEAFGQSHLIFYEWAVADEHNVPMSSWQQKDTHSKGEMSVCIPETNTDGRHLCVRVSCPSGLSQTSCVAAGHASKQKKLIEVRQKSLQTVRTALNLLHDNTLQAFDIDFAQSATIISGVLSDLRARNSTWFLMTEPHLPSTKCQNDPTCVTAIEVSGPIASFSSVSLREGTKYYVCAHNFNETDASGYTSPEISECGDGFLVDNSPPGPGHLKIAKSKNGFLTEQDVVTVFWSGFDDASHINFSCSLGTYPGGQDVVAFSDAISSHHKIMSNITLQNGQTFYASVKACDQLGFCTVASSDPVQLDISAPATGTIFVGDSMLSHRVVNPYKLLVYWSGFEDPESGILHTYLTVASTENDELVPFKEYTGTFADLSQSMLMDGHEYFIKLKITNRAGMTSVALSDPFIADNSPPYTGSVRDGDKTDREELDYDTQTDSYTCHWSGFHDPHSQLSHFEVGLGTRPNKDDIETMTTVGLKTETTWTGQLPLGVKLFCTVETCNYAGLCSSSSSDGVILDNSPPVPGVVFVGSTGQHEKYHGHISTLAAQWYGFEDPQTGINHFDWCLGSSAGHCDIVPWTNNLLSDSVIKTGHSLPVGVPLYVSVNATNPAGLTSTATSDSFVVDSSPPAVSNKPSFTDPYSQGSPVAVQWENSLLHLKWKFVDPDSPIQRHLVTLFTHHDGSSAIEDIHLGALDSTIILFKPENLMRNGDTYTANITACNAAGLCSTSSSNPILIDSTPPQTGGIKSPLFWEHINGTTRLELEWTGFTDSESLIHHYMVSVSKTYDDAELSGGFGLVPQNNTSSEQACTIVVPQILRAGENIIITIIAVNNAGLQSDMAKVTMAMIASNINKTRGIIELQRHSCALHYCSGSCTCAVVGQLCSVSSSQSNCTNASVGLSPTDITILPGLEEDLTVTSSASCLTAHFTPASVKVMQLIKRLEWSFGQYGQKIGTGVLLSDESVWRENSKANNTTFCLPNGRSLKHNTKYIVYLRAWTGFSNYMIYKSHPIRVDHTPPSLKRTHSVLDADEMCTEDKEFFQKGQIIAACWDNVFGDDQSKIIDFEFWLGTSPESDDVIQPISMKNKTSYKIPLARIQSGTKYFSSVRATNQAGLQTVDVSDGFLVDVVPPVAGVIFNTNRHRNIKYQSSNTSLGASWHGFEDYHSFIKRFEIGVIPEGTRLTNSVFEYTAFGNELLLHNVSFMHNKRYSVAIKSIDAAGLSSQVVMSPSVLVDVTPPTAFSCQSYNAKSLNYHATRTDSPQGHTIEVQGTDTLKKGVFYKLNVEGQSKLVNSHITFNIGKLVVTGRFHKTPSGLEASHRFLNSESGRVNISIIITGKDVTNSVKLTLEECQSLKRTNEKGAIDIRQIRPSVISVCTRVHDTESGIRSIWLGAGTSEGGYQIRPLSPTAVSNHEMILVKEPHGSPVYVTAMAENNAGLRTMFTSNPILIDHTPPEISNISSGVTYGPSVTVSLSVKWHVMDNETGILNCFCRVKPDHKKWQESRPLGFCEIHSLSVKHGSVINADIRCVNKIGLESEASSDPLTVLLHPPVLPVDQESVQVLVDKLEGSKLPGRSIQGYTDHVEFAWRPSSDPGLQSFECRLMEDDSNITDWRSTDKRTHAYLDGLKLQDGHQYTVQVRTVNTRAQYGNLVNSSFMVESRSPSTTGSQPLVNLANSRLTIDWVNVFSHFHLDITYIVTVGSRKGFADVLKNYETKDTYITTVTDTNEAGVYITILAKVETGEFGLHSSFVPFGLASR